MEMTFEKLTSVKNPTIQMLRALKDKKARDEAGMMLVEGEKLLGEALACHMEPGFLLFDEARPLPEALIQAFFEAGAQVHPVSEHVLKAVCDTQKPQGSCAAFGLPSPLREYPDRLVALDGVQDPGNVGTIWRTADAAGFGGLLLSDACADPFSPKVQRAAMGSGFRVGCATGALDALLDELKASGHQVIVSTLSGTSFYARAPLGERYVLVIGSEAHGVSASVLSRADVNLKLPMHGGAESLNAAVAAGIMMYELTRTLTD